MKTKREEKKEQQWCPYCEDEIANSQLPFCQPCKVTQFNCPECGKTAPRTKKICPSCGAKMKPDAAKVS
jgi:hypothetical protein